MQYKLTTGTSGTIIQVDDAGITSFVPPDPSNRHYAAYLAWLAQGHTPTPAG